MMFVLSLVWHFPGRPVPFQDALVDTNNLMDDGKLELQPAFTTGPPTEVRPQ